MIFQPRPGFKGSDPVISISDLGIERIKQQFSLMLLYEAQTLEGVDIEALHIMRVASRRLRVAISVFGKALEPPIPCEIRSYLRETGHQLGAVRDFDVLIQSLADDLNTKSPGERESLQYFVHFCERERSLLRREMAAYIDSEAYRKFKEYFGTFCTQRSIKTALSTTNARPDSFARTAIRKKQLAMPSPENLSRETPIETLHRIRISVKKLRYTVEFLMEPLFPDVEDYLERLKSIQDQLGLIHDAHFLILQYYKFCHSDILANDPPKVKTGPITADSDQYLQQKIRFLEEMIARFLQDYKASHCENIGFLNTNSPSP